MRRRQRDPLRDLALARDELPPGLDAPGGARGGADVVREVAVVVGRGGRGRALGNAR